MSPTLAWQQIEILGRHGLHFFFETGDTATIGNYLRQLIENRPASCKDVTFRLYAIPDQVEADIADSFAHLAEEIYLGVESANDQVLARAGKTFRRNDVENAADLLTERGMALQFPFMYGLPGETPESANETLEFAKYLVRKYNPRRMAASFAVPLPGTKLFETIVRSKRARSMYPRRSRAR